MNLMNPLHVKIEQNEVPGEFSLIKHENSIDNKKILLFIYLEPNLNI